MLIRCTKCGKPVFCTPGFRRIECGYCYAMITEAGESPRQLLPSESDWMGPLLEHIGSLPLKDADPDWTALLKDEPAFIKLRDELMEKAAALAREKMETIARQMERALQPEDIDGLLGDLAPLMQMPGARELFGALQEKKSALLARRKLEEEEARRKQLRARRLKIITAAAACLAAVIWCLISVFVIRPRDLEKARSLAAAGDYAAAESAYAALARGGFLANPSVSGAASGELTALRSSWAEFLVSRGQWEEAAAKYTLAGDDVRARKTLTAYAAQLEDEDRLEEALRIWQRIGGIEAETKTAALNAMLYRQRLDAGDHENALKYLESAGFNEKELTSRREELYLRWGNALAEQGDMAGAVGKWGSAGSGPEIDSLILDARKALIREEAAPVLELWKAEGSEAAKEKWIEALRVQGEALTRADEVLYFFHLLDEAGVKLVKVFPHGAVVTDISACGLDTQAPGEADYSRPLAVWRLEKDYTLSQIDLLIPWTDHDSMNSGNYTVRLLSSLWQALPEERRPRSMADCTCVLLADCVYIPRSDVPARFLIPQFDPLYPLNRSGPTPRTTLKPTSMKGMLRLYAARTQVMLWRWPAMEAEIAARKDVDPERRVDPLSADEIVVDWSVVRNGVSSRSLGLSGQFDTDWLSNRIQEVFLKLLTGEENGDGNES